MFVMTVKRRILTIITLALLALTIIFLADRFLPDGLLPVSASVSASDHLERANFLKGYGWEISTVPLETEQVTIPVKFNDVYEKYNQMQISQGFDLAPYKGKAVTRYTYSVINYPDEIKNVRANILVYQNKVIGGDICTLSLDGFMHTFDHNEHKTGIMESTFYNVN